jgi:hypothetical protein
MGRRREGVLFSKMQTFTKTFWTNRLFLGMDWTK